MGVHDRYVLCGNFRTPAQQKYSGTCGEPPGGSLLAKRVVSCGTGLRDTERHGTAVKKRYAIPRPVTLRLQVLRQAPSRELHVY